MASRALCLDYSSLTAIKEKAPFCVYSTSESEQKQLAVLVNRKYCLSVERNPWSDSGQEDNGIRGPLLLPADSSAVLATLGWLEVSQ